MIVNFSGSCEVDTNDIIFVKTEDMSVKISGNEWILMSEEEKEEYIIESMGHTISKANDVTWESIELQHRWMTCSRVTPPL